MTNLVCNERVLCLAATFRQTQSESLLRCIRRCHDTLKEVMTHIKKAMTDLLAGAITSNQDQLVEAITGDIAVASTLQSLFAAVVIVLCCQLAEEVPDLCSSAGSLDHYAASHIPGLICPAYSTDTLKGQHH